MSFTLKLLGCDDVSLSCRKDKVRFFSQYVPASSLVSLAGGQHWTTVSAFLTCMSISHLQAAAVAILELPESHEIGILFRSITESCGLLISYADEIA